MNQRFCSSATISALISPSVPQLDQPRWHLDQLPLPFPSSAWRFQQQGVGSSGRFEIPAMAGRAGLPGALGAQRSGLQLGGPRERSGPFSAGVGFRWNSTGQRTIGLPLTTPDSSCKHIPQQQNHTFSGGTHEFFPK